MMIYTKLIEKLEEPSQVNTNILKKYQKIKF